MNKIHLKDIESNLSKCLIEVDHDFLKELFVKSSGLLKPYKSQKFAEKIGLKYNNKCQLIVGLNILFRKNRAINFETLRALKNMTNIGWSEIESNMISLRLGRSKGKVYLKFPIKIDHCTGLIIGHVLGDGSIDKKYLQVSYTNQDLDLIKEFSKAMESIFGIEPRIWLQDPGNFKKQSKWIKRINTFKNVKEKSQIGLFYPSICGLLLNIIFDDFAVGKKKRITRKMLISSIEFKIGLVRAFFDDEGHMDKERGPRFHQDRKLMLEKLKVMLNEMGIESFPVRTYIRRGKERYFFNVNRYKNYSAYYHLIGCSSKKKYEVLKTLVGKNKKN